MPDEKQQEAGESEEQELTEEEKKALEEDMEEEGMDTFFRGDSFVRAHPDEYEGHYPGNQNNAILIPYKKRVVYSS